MKSSTGQHFAALDHVRGIAAFIVVTWHFTHAGRGFPVPFGTAPILGFLDEGHVGVALFMTLSGYLFAKLLDGKDICIGPFLWNRFLRLGPLLILVFALVGLREWLSGNLSHYLWRLTLGPLFPTWPNGGWSIAVEMHFYLFLPFLLLFMKRQSYLLLALVACALFYRAWLFQDGSDIQLLAYRTIIGRIDQFLLGMFAFRHGQGIARWFAALTLGAFLLSYSAFDLAGGYYRLDEAARGLWVLLPTWEGACFAVLIAWYDRNPLRDGRLTRPLQKAGEYSYSVYLLHFFFYPAAARFVHERIMDISSFYLALPWALLFFTLMIVYGHFSFKYFEKPFLRYRKTYLIEPERRVREPAFTTV